MTHSGLVESLRRLLLVFLLQKRTEQEERQLRHGEQMIKNDGVKFRYNQIPKLKVPCRDSVGK